MASLNKIMLIGHCGRDPESRTFPSGDMVTNVSIATTETWKDKQTSEKREATEWHRLQFTGGLAKVAADYLRKGSQVFVEGSLKTRKWKDNDGNEKTAVEVRVDQMKMLGTPGGNQGSSSGGGGYGGGQQQRAAAPAQQQKKNSGFDDMDDDIPF